MRRQRRFCLMLAALALCAFPGTASAELIRHEGYRNDGTRIAGSVTVAGESTEIGERGTGWTRINAWTWSHVDERGNVDGTSVTDPAKVAAGHWERSGEELRWRLPDGSTAVGLIRVPAPDGSGDMQWSYGRLDGEIVRGTFCITEGGASHTYIADGSGRLLMDGTGWVRVPKITSGTGSSGVGVYYTDGTHAAVSGLFSVGGKAYYAPPELGYANFGKAERDGWLMLSDDDGALPSHEGWFGPGADKGGEMHYVTHMGDVDGIPVYAERSDGASILPAQTMLPVLDGRRYVVCERKDLPSGFVTRGGKTLYFDPATHKAVRWEQVIGGRLYYFDKDCAMHRGWLTWNKDGSRSYFGADGAAVSGWKNDGNRRYYLSPKTFHSVRWTQTIDGKTYYFDSDYAMHTGWLQWKAGKDKGRWSYFDKSGAMVLGKRTIDGAAYDFGKSGCVTRKALLSCNGGKRMARLACILAGSVSDGGDGRAQALRHGMGHNGKVPFKKAKYYADEWYPRLYEYYAVHDMVCGGNADRSTKYAQCDTAVGVVVLAAYNPKYQLNVDGYYRSVVSVARAGYGFRHVGDIRGSKIESFCRPGDVLYKSNHVMIYVGNDIVREYYPNAGKHVCIYEAGGSTAKYPGLTVVNRAGHQNSTWHVYRPTDDIERHVSKRLCVDLTPYGIANASYYSEDAHDKAVARVLSHSGRKVGSKNGELAGTLGGEYTYKVGGRTYHAYWSRCDKLLNRYRSQIRQLGGTASGN